MTVYCIYFQLGKSGGLCNTYFTCFKTRDEDNRPRSGKYYCYNHFGTLYWMFDVLHTINDIGDIVL